METNKVKLLKYIGLVVGLTAKFATGSIFVFNVYQDAIKETFNYTQKEVELLSSMLNVGIGVGFVPGMVYDRFGPTLTSGAGLLISVPTFILIWSTTKYISFYSTRAWLMSIYFFFCGFGSVFTYMVALNTNVINFHQKHTGKVVGFLNAFFAGSPSVFATLYYNVFTSGDQTVVANQDFAGFMIFLAILCGAVDLLCMAFLRVYSNPANDLEDMNVPDDITTKVYKDDNGVAIDNITTAINEKLDETTDINFEVSQNNNSSSDNNMSLCKLLVNLDFYLFVLMFAFASSVGLVYVNNITVTSKSVGIDAHNDKLVIIIPVTNAVVSSLVGIISDVFKDKVPRLMIVVGSCIAFMVSQILVIALAERLSMFVTSTVFAGIGVGILWSLCPTIMKEKFSMEHLGRNWGIALLFSALLALASQYAFGALYDAELGDGKGTFCYGAHCIRNGYFMMLGYASLSLCLGIFISVHKHCCKQRKSE